MPRSKWSAQAISLHVFRACMFCSILVLIRWQAQEFRAAVWIAESELLPAQFESYFPAVTYVTAKTKDRSNKTGASSLGEQETSVEYELFDADGVQLGLALQTSPEADTIIGFSGPSNVLLALDADHRLVGVEILSSGDTRDHVRQVEQDPNFLESLLGLSREELLTADIDTVSGATLTSLAIQESIRLRLAGSQAGAGPTKSLRFPDAPTAATVQSLFPTASSLEVDEENPMLIVVFDAAQKPIGTVFRTAPSADNVIGYQGPSDTLVGLDSENQVRGIRIQSSYDNQPYVDYVREDEYFLNRFNGYSLLALSQLDLVEEQIEGVSGATMTSLAVAEGLAFAAKAINDYKAPEIVEAEQPGNAFALSPRDFGTGLVVLIGLGIGLTRLRGSKTLRWAFQLALIGYLGLINGDLLSQAMIVGWASSGVPWRAAGGLLMLTIAAFAVPLLTKSNIYCSHLCPHGAVQQLVKNRRWRMSLSPKNANVLKWLPWCLLAWCIAVPMLALPFSLVDIEPFDAWVFRVAGWATIVVAVVGLSLSFFFPMAYCRYGCPTGAVLSFLRLNSYSGRWSGRDSAAIALVLFALLLWRFV